MDPRAGNQGANPPNNPFGGSQQQDHQDFVDCFRQGPQAVTDQEAATRYQQVAPQLPPDVYQQSAQDVFAQLTPEQRMQLGQQLIQQARQQGQSFPDVNGDGIDDRLQDPNFLAQKTTQVHQQQPGLLGQLLGGGLAGGAGGGHAAGGGALAGGGGTAGGVGSGMGGMLSSPLAKGVLGGIAGAGLMRMLGGGHHYGGGGLFGAPHMGGYFGGGMGGMGGMDEMYEEAYEEGLEDAYGGGDFGGISEVTSGNKALLRRTGRAC